MSDDDAPPSLRAGSGADLARRMDSIEKRQDGIEQEVRTLTATVVRVEQNQNHGEELNKLRFDALTAAVGNVGGTLAAFITRIEGIVTGETETAQSRQGRELLRDYLEWRETVDDHIEKSKLERATGAAKTQGMVVALTGGRALVLTLAAVVAPIVAIIVALSN
jgi:hypothetical protein